MNKNTLDIVRMEVIETTPFLDSFVGQPVTFWVGREPIYYSLSKVTGYKFLLLAKDKRTIIFFGNDDHDKFGIDVNYGFGVRIQGTKNDYWIDKINEKEVALIQYSEEKFEELD